MCNFIVGISIKILNIKLLCDKMNLEHESIVFDERSEIVKEKTMLDNKKTYTVSEIANMLSIGKTSAYNLVKENHFKVVKIGASIRISKKSFDDWLNNMN